MSHRAHQAGEMMASRKANCAQCLLTSFSDDLGLPQETAFTVAQCFGGGMHIDSTCGAVTGSFMVLGLANPVSKENPRASQDRLGVLTGEFCRRFKEKHGSLDCTELLGYNVTDPAQAAEAREKGVFSAKCPNFVRDAAAIVEDLFKPA